MLGSQPAALLEVHEDTSGFRSHRDADQAEATGGKTYAELDREDPVRETAMTASFLCASLFTSVVAFGVAAMAFGIGVVLVIFGWG